MSNDPILQDLFEVTVQIRTSNDSTIGTGFVIDHAARIVTCAHVVQDALGKHPRMAIGESVKVYFPQVNNQDDRPRMAKVAKCFPDYDDDVVLLELSDGRRPPTVDFAILGTADASRGHEFLAYGYAELGDKESRNASGKILGQIQDANDDKRQLRLYELDTTKVRGGMSGGAVLDTKRNLVVGLITSRWNTHGHIEDSDVAWATNARVLSLAPLNLPLQDHDEPRKPGPTNQLDNIDSVRQLAQPNKQIFWGSAPGLLDEWVGRQQLLTDIQADFAAAETLVTGLIGYGGEGKSSVARRWVDQLLHSHEKVDGVFWWAFYDLPNTDKFMEAALKFLAPEIDVRNVPGASRKANMIAALLATGRYVFILDGFEVMQAQRGDRYGEVTSNDMRTFLELFATPGDPPHKSYCLITSRAPLLNLLKYATYRERPVMALNAAEGRELLRKVGVTGADDDLEKVVEQWGGHALTISLVGAYLKDAHGGDIAKMSELPPPNADEDRYERVHRILRRYDEHLSEAERAFLTLFSVFRTPVEQSAFEQLFRAESANMTLNAPLVGLSDAEFEKIVERLRSYRMLRRFEATYTTHPLIRAHYFGLLTQRADASDTHASAKDYYLALAGDDEPRFPTMEELQPLIEVVYHACRAGLYDEARRIMWERIHQRDRFLLTKVLGAYETTLALMREFFPGGDLSGEPGVSDPRAKRWILNTVGFSLQQLGRGRAAVPFYERKNAIALEMEDWHNASGGYQNLTDLHRQLGQLADAAHSADEALRMAELADNRRDKCNSLATQAWVTHLRGAEAGELFQQAEALEREIDANKQYLYSLLGIWHADYLRRVGEADYARRVTEANLKSCEEYRWTNNVSQCHRILGDLDADAGQHTSARDHYDRAVNIARGLQRLDVRIEALLGRGRWAARHADVATAQSDLHEALQLALAGEWRLYEADARVGLAWLHQRMGESASAQQEAALARQISAETGYVWPARDLADF